MSATQPRPIHVRILMFFRDWRAGRNYGHAVGTDRSIADIKRDFEQRGGTPGRCLVRTPYPE